jgi:endonuclease/exonuclease/phosphatase family metal-dependent hydrolase
MSYHLDGAKKLSAEAELFAPVIRAQQPDLVLIQQYHSAPGATPLACLADAVGLTAYGDDGEGGCAFLSRYPLTNLRNFPLGYGYRCLQADLDHNDERVHLFNLVLTCHPLQRKEQVRLLLSDQLLNQRSLPCATLIAGDFGVPLWGTGQLNLNLQLQRSRWPLWRANYPAVAPLVGRDRIYFRGPIRALSGYVVRDAAARRASSHLPLVLTVETCEMRQFLKSQQRSRVTAKQPTPICG